MIHHEPLRSIMKLLLYSTVLKAIENHNDCYPDTKPHLCSGIVSLIHIFFFSGQSTFYLKMFAILPVMNKQDFYS